jgi:DNA repair protein RadB
MYGRMDGLGKPMRVGTGFEALNAFLDGGYETDAITTIYGPAGAGKTNLALLAAITAARAGKKVIYVDTEGGFSVTRLEQLAAKDSRKVLERIIFLKPTTFEQQARAIEQLRELAASPKIGLIIVDTIGMLYRLERRFGDESSHDFNRELGLQLELLNEISRTKEIPVLLVNQVYSSFDTGQVAMVGGDILKYTSKCLLELQNLQNGRRRAVLRKHRSLPSDRELLFEIAQEGLREAHSVRIAPA